LPVIDAHKYLRMQEAGKEAKQVEGKKLNSFTFDWIPFDSATKNNPKAEQDFLPNGIAGDHHNVSLYWMKKEIGKCFGIFRFRLCLFVTQ